MTQPLDRAEFPVTERWAYLNHAGVAPLPAGAADAIDAYARAVERDGGQATPGNDARVEEVRTAGAAMMGVDADDVAFVKNTTEGLGFVANGLCSEGTGWSEGDRVVVPSIEFPSNLFPWTALRERGVDVVELDAVGEGQRLPLEAFEKALVAGGVRLVAVSWVQYARGWRVDVAGLARLCREHDALLVVDAIQGLGVVPAAFDDWGVDAVVADGHKWLLGPEGCGLMYVSPAFRDQLRVLEPGWHSVVQRGDYEDHRLVHDPTARRFEGGTPNYAGVWGLGASLDLLLETGVDRVWSHVDALCSRLVDGLAEVGAEVLTDRSGDGGSGIVAFRPASAGRKGDVDVDAAAAALIECGFVVRARAGAIRVSPHGYNTLEEIDALVEAVAGLA